MIEKLPFTEIHSGGEDMVDRVEFRPVQSYEMQHKINELVDAVNKYEDIIRQIGEWGTSKGECLWCENITAVNLNDRMIGCTTLDIPESYKNDPYEKQRKWIGKVVKGCPDNDNDLPPIYGILNKILDSHCPSFLVDGTWCYQVYPIDENELAKDE